MNVLFLLHGVGRHPSGWANDPIAALQKAMPLYPACFKPGKTLADYVKPVEIRYDDIFDTILDRWVELANALPTAGGGFAWTSKVAELLQKAGDNRNTFARFGGDVLLYAGFRLVARAARLRVNALIATTIYEETKAAVDAGLKRPRFAVVAHSLGTTIAQDALYQLATGRWTSEQQSLDADVAETATAAGLNEQQKNALSGSLTSSRPAGNLAVNLHGLFLVSDTSPVLHQSGYYSEHQPTNGVYDCQAIWTINHEFDPISHVGGAFTGTWRPDRKDVRVRHFHEKNIHAFAHYLAHPSVHCEIFRLLVPEFSAACYQAARTLAAQPMWNGFGGALADWLEEEKSRLKQKLLDAAQLDKAPPKLREAIEAYFRSIGLL
ncbi:MAG TPA: hypothetical protein VJQ58_11610 [Burkholderiales bacterium]|nr:hypothetical protein [Burkholderiales bacterium]